MDEFFNQLKQRKLVQWALAYVAAAFALIQVADIVGQRFGWPETVVRGVILTLAIGFFVTIVLAWYHGEKGAQRVSGTELLILTLLLAIGGGLLWRIAAVPSQGTATTTEGELKPAAPPDTHNRQSIAVLPFTDLSPDKNQEYFSDGMAEEILNALAQVPGLKVAGRTSSFYYKGKNENLQVIGKTLGVAHILEGSVRKQGDKVRITAQLILAADDSHLWSHEYDGTLSDVFELQERIARAITEQLKLVLQGEPKPFAAQKVQNVEAYQFFLRGQFLWHLRGYRNLQMAADAYKAALDKDPDYADAWAGLAQVYTILPEYYETDMANTGHAEDTTRLALDAADHALRLQPNSAAALLARAYVRGARQFDWLGTDADFRAVIVANPQDATAHQWYGEILMYQRRFAEADAQFAAMRAIDPVAVIAQHLSGFSLAMQGRYVEALPYLDESLRIVPGFYFALGWKLNVLVTLNRFGEAKAAALSYPPERRELALAFVAAMQDPSLRDKTAARIRAEWPAGDLLMECMLAMLGREDLALDAVDEMFRTKAPFRAFAYSNPVFRNLRSNPRFIALMKEVNLPPAGAEAKTN